MQILNINIERSNDMFSAYADNAPGIYGGGDTVEETKQSILDAIQIYKEELPYSNIPEILNGNYQIVYHFDAEMQKNYRTKK